MALRVARTTDIEAMHAVRLGVRENILNDPRRVLPEDYRRMLEQRGRGWVHEKSGQVVAFGIADHAARNVWALFVLPEFERRGIGRSLLRTMVAWLFAQSGEPIWLTTEPGSRAERFYEAAGWRNVGLTDHGEVRFELDAQPKP
jgi:GNAT superfamily N-acetyltransferase